MRTVGNARRRIRSPSSRSLKSKTNVIVQRDPLSVSILVFICEQTATDRNPIGTADPQLGKERYGQQLASSNVSSIRQDRFVEKDGKFPGCRIEAAIHNLTSFPLYVNLLDCQLAYLAR